MLIEIPAISMPQPDLAVIAAGTAANHSRARRLIENAVTTRSLDVGEKARRYAMNGYPEHQGRAGRVDRRALPKTGPVPLTFGAGRKARRGRQRWIVGRDGGRRGWDAIDGRAATTGGVRPSCTGPGGGVTQPARAAPSRPGSAP